MADRIATPAKSSKAPLLWKRSTCRHDAEFDQRPELASSTLPHIPLEITPFAPTDGTNAADVTEALKFALMMHNCCNPTDSVADSGWADTP